MVFTKKQRKAIYLAAYKRIRDKKNTFCCTAIYPVIHYKVTNLQDHFPELFLFKPKNRKNINAWFTDPFITNKWEESITYRTTVLLLCAEMCND